MRYYWVHVHGGLVQDEVWDIDRLLTPRGRWIESPEGAQGDLLQYDYVVAKGRVHGRRIGQLCFYEVYVPIVSGQVLSYVRDNLMDCVQLVPVRAPRSVPECCLMNVTKKIACLDEKRTDSFVINGTRQYLSVAVDAMRVPAGAKVFREAASKRLIFCSDVKGAIEEFCRQDVEFAFVGGRRGRSDAE